MPVSRIPSKYLRGVANAGLRDVCVVERNDGNGWGVLHSETPCNIQHIDYRPQPADPADASAENGENVSLHFKRNLPVRTGDRAYVLSSPTRKWVFGGGNMNETMATFQLVRAMRPTAATPWTKIVVYRISNPEDDPIALPDQIVQFVLSTRVPAQVGVSTYKGGIMFGPEGLPPLDIEIGDTFIYNEMRGYVTWVTPNPSERREATFYLDLPTPWPQ